MSVKILLADDSRTIQKIVHQTFEHEPVELTLLNNGDAALRQLEEDRPDLVLADVFMPGKNGYEVCEFIKQHPALAEIPVVLLIGAFEPFDEKEAARVRADGHLEKPFASKILLETVKRFVTWNSLEDISEKASEAEEAATPGSPQSTQGPSYETDVPVSSREPETPPVSPEPPSRAVMSLPPEPIHPLAVTEPAVQESRIFDEPIPVPIETEMPAEISPLEAGPSETLAEAPIFSEDFSSLTPVVEPDSSTLVETAVAAEVPDHPALNEAAPNVSADAIAPPSPPSPPTPVDEFAEFQRHVSIHSEHGEDVSLGPVEVAGPPIPPSMTIAHEMAPSTMEELMGETPPSLSSGEEREAPPTSEIVKPSIIGPSTELSPEMIEAIAQRVVEKMSSRVIEEIAWEVVPEMAEALLRKNLSEKK